MTSDTNITTTAVTVDNNINKYNCTLRIPFECNKHAEYVKTCLEVDEELQPTKITKDFIIDGCSLVVEFHSCELKVLRVAISSLYDMTIVCIKTLLEFA